MSIAVDADVDSAVIGPIDDAVDAAVDAAVVRSISVVGAVLILYLLCLGAIFDIAAATVAVAAAAVLMVVSSGLQDGNRPRT